MLLLRKRKSSKKWQKSNGKHNFKCKVCEKQFQYEFDSDIIGSAGLRYSPAHKPKPAEPLPVLYVVVKLIFYFSE